MRSPRWGWTYGLAVGFVALRVLALGAGNNFFYDEWQFVTERRSLSTASLLVPHNGHLSAVPAAVFMVLLKIVGLGHYGAFRLAVLLAHLIVAVLTAVLVRRRFGDWAGVGTLVVVGLMGAGWQNIFWALQFGYVTSVAALLAALVTLDRGRGEPSRRDAVLASSFVAVSLLSSGVGVPALVAVTWLCLAGPHRRSLWWVPVGPALMYGVWYLKYGTSSVMWSSYRGALAYTGESASAAIGGVFGLGERAGQLMAGVLLMILANHVITRRVTVGSITPLVFYGVFIGLVALSRSSSPEPQSSRYLYVGIVAMLAALALARPREDPSPTRMRALLLAVAAVWGSNATLEHGAEWLRNQGDIVSAELAVVEAHRDSLDPLEVVDPVHAPTLSVGAYLEAVDDLGSSAAADLAGIPSMRLSARTGADLVVNRLVSPESTGIVGEDCVPVESAVTSLVLEPGGSALVSGWGPGTFLVHRFALEEARVAPRELDLAVVRFSVPADRSPVPYTITFDPAVDVVTCA